MFKQNDKVVIKDLETLLKNNNIQKMENLNDVYSTNDKTFVLFDDFPFFNQTVTVSEVDDNDPNIPYFLSCGVWVPKFMITAYEEPKVEKVIMEAEEPRKEEAVAEKPKEILNKFTNKPFGKLFMRLINLDEKIAEFSNTSFSKLKKHELVYIAKLLIDNGAEKIDYNKALKEDLIIYCFKATVNLNVQA